MAGTSTMDNGCALLGRRMMLTGAADMRVVLSMVDDVARLTGMCRQTEHMARACTTCQRTDMDSDAADERRCAKIV